MNDHMMDLDEEEAKLPILTWCDNLEEGALEQAIDLANHPVVVGHVALMPDCHQGYGMPIGGVIACRNAVIPNAVGVDIGCGMSAIQTNLIADKITKPQLRDIINRIKDRIPMGAGHAHKEPQKWSSMDALTDCMVYEPRTGGWFNQKMWHTVKCNLGTLGGGNHFIEIQKGSDGYVWLMLHSGSRNFGYQVAKYYNDVAKKLNDQWRSAIPCNDLAFLPTDSQEGQDYISSMNFALSYAQENRNRMMQVVMECVDDVMKRSVGMVYFTKEINIHHNYAAIEHHLGKNLWIHRKGATSAREGQMGIIPGAMGSFSYIVKGKGVASSFQSCSHGAGRTMSRTKASATLNREECDEAMEGVVWDGFKKWKGHKKQEDSKYDLSESPQAYKDIASVMEAQEDLVEIVVELKTLAVLKG
jgi:tRNA-splicing ligase RtcB